MTDDFCTCGTPTCTGYAVHTEPDHLMVDGVELRTVTVAEWIAAEKRAGQAAA